MTADEVDRPRSLDTREVFAGRVLRLVVDRVAMPSGVTTELEIVRHGGAAAVVPVTEAGEVVLVRQYRHAVGDWLLEVPAGKLDGGEDPAACAARELAEEAGLAAGRLRSLGPIWTTPGFSDERIWLFLATELSEVPQSLEEDELLSVERLPLADAVAAAVRGEIADGKSVCALLRAASSGLLG